MSLQWMVAGSVGVAATCCGLVVAGDRLIRPEATPAPVVNVADEPYVRHLAAENHELRTEQFRLRCLALELAEQKFALELERNAAIRELARQRQGTAPAQPDVAPGDMIPPTTLPTKEQ